MSVTNVTLRKLDELSEEELRRIEQLAESACAGPWISYIVGRDAYAGWNRIEVGLCNELGSCQCLELVGAGAADQDFIASARQDVPRLIREVRFLRARLEALLAGESDATPHGLDAPQPLRPAHM